MTGDWLERPLSPPKLMITLAAESTKNAPALKVGVLEFFLVAWKGRVEGVQDSLRGMASVEFTRYVR